ncbi:MAG: IS3 family transposase [Nanoarchaeota archaeon]
MINELVIEGHTVKNICRVLGLSRSQYYRQRQSVKDVVVSEHRKEKREEILEKIRLIKSEHPFWGYRRTRAYLQYKLNIHVSRKYVYRLMKDNALLVDVKQYKAKRRDQRAKPIAERQNQIWGTDMTKFYIDTVGWIYFVVVLDWYTKKIVGWDLSLRCKTDQWLAALNQAVDEELIIGSREYGLMLISDNGSQPTSIKYENNCSNLEIKHITTSYSNPKGNAETERFFRTFKEEVVWANMFDKVEDAAKAVENFIMFYNNDYPHSALGNISPVDFIKKLNLKKAA